MGRALPAHPPRRPLPTLRWPRRESPGPCATGRQGRSQRRDDGQLPDDARGRALGGPRDVRGAGAERRPAARQRGEPPARQPLGVARGRDSGHPDRRADRQPGGRQPLGSLDAAPGDQEEREAAGLSRAPIGQGASAGGLGRLVIELSERLAELESSGLRRRLRLIDGPQGPEVLMDGRPVLLLCSNNYLGLADHPRLRQAAAEAALDLGTSAGASRLISGSMSIHAELESRLAAFKGTEAALLFGSGYLANVGVISSLAHHGTVFSDALNHASIIDGCRLARAEAFVYRHN